MYSNQGPLTKVIQIGRGSDYNVAKTIRNLQVIDNRLWRISYSTLFSRRFCTWSTVCYVAHSFCDETSVETSPEKHPLLTTTTPVPPRERRRVFWSPRGWSTYVRRHIKVGVSIHRHIQSRSLIRYLLFWARVSSFLRILARPGSREGFLGNVMF